MNYVDHPEISPDDEPIIRVIKQINIRLRELESENEKLRLEVQTIKLLIEESK